MTGNAALGKKKMVVIGLPSRLDSIREINHLCQLAQMIKIDRPNVDFVGMRHQVKIYRND